MRRWPAVLVTALLLLNLGRAPARAGAAARSVAHGDATCRRIALTFDAEIIPARTRAILDVLAHWQARSTWFLTGFSVRAYPEIAREIAVAHEVGNHTDNHPYLTHLTPAAVAEEVQGAAGAISAATGALPVPLFRPPYGAYSSQVLQVVGDLGYAYSVMWSVDTRDWEGSPAGVIADRILAGAAPGGIVLMHGSAPHTAAGLEQAMAELWQRGYQFTTVGNLLGLAPDQRDLGGSRYVVQDGDTLTGVARCWRVSGAALGAANGIEPGGGVPAGRILTIPYADQVNLELQGAPLDLGQPLRSSDGHTAVPLTPLARALGARLAWDRPDGTVAVQLGLRMLHLHIGRAAALASGRPVTLQQAPELREGELWVPLRALCQALDVHLAWDANARAADLTPPTAVTNLSGGRGRGERT